MSNATPADAGSTGSVSSQKTDYPWLRSYPAGVDFFKLFIPFLLHEGFEKTVRKFADKPAVSFLGTKLNYRELGDRVNRAAKGLQSLGIGKGDHVGLLLPNCPTYIVYYYAILKLGGVVVNFNPLYSVPELSFQAKDARVKTIVTLDLEATLPKAVKLQGEGVLDKIVVERFQDLLPQAKALALLLLKRKMLAKRALLRAERVYFARAFENNDGKVSSPAMNTGDLAVLQYTGGTTGTPKGAMLTHANLSINVQQADTWFGTRTKEGEERVLCIIPFFHVFAMTCLMNTAVLKGSQMIVLPKFDIGETLRVIDKERPTIFAGVPTLYNALSKAKDIGKHDLSSFKFCHSGGAPLPLEVKREFEKVSGCTLVEGYGLSETSPITHINPPDGPVKEGSIGLPIPGTIVSLRDLDAPEKEVPLGEKGEICICGPQVMQGYWNKPKETAQAFVGPFLRTGDVATMDEEGFTYIVDRIKDMILCSGFNVYPRRIEEALYEHPAVAEVTVVGAPDEYRGETPIAFVTLRKGASASEEELKAFLRPRISKIEMPSRIEFREALPKTLIGKLSKKELRAEAQEEAKASG